MRPIAYPHHRTATRKRYVNQGNDVPGQTFSPFFSPDIQSRSSYLRRTAALGSSPQNHQHQGLRGRAATVLLCAHSRRPVGPFQDTGVWTEVRVRFSSRLIALSPVSGADLTWAGLHPFLSKSDLACIRRHTLTSPSPPHGRRRTTWDRAPLGAATDGHDIHCPPTFPSAISNHRPRCRSRERPLRRTRPPLMERRRGKGFVRVWWQLFESNVSRRRPPIAQ